jgi:hypothetical protein
MIPRCQDRAPGGDHQRRRQPAAGPCSLTFTTGG